MKDVVTNSLPFSEFAKEYQSNMILVILRVMGRALFDDFSLIRIFIRLYFVSPARFFLSTLISITNELNESKRVPK